MNETTNIVELARRVDDGCPSSDALAQFFIERDHGAFPSIDRHLRQCARCRSIFQAIKPMRVFDEELRLGVGVANRDRRRLAWTALAASVLVGVGLTLILGESSVSFDPTHRSSARRGLQIEYPVSPSPSAILAAAPSRLTFDPRPDHTTSIALFDAALERLWEGEGGTSGSVILPEGVRNRMTAGQTYYWQVTHQTGVDRETSPLFAFTIDEGAR